MSVVPQAECEILDALVGLRQRLTGLKRDRTEFIKPLDVQGIYDIAIEQVTRLNVIRQNKKTEENRVDLTLNDVFQLLSLFFLTIGRTQESPALFSQIATMRQLLQEVEYSSIYTAADLEPMVRRAKELKEIVERDALENKHPPALTDYLLKKIASCQRRLDGLLDGLALISVDLVPLHQRLVSIRRQLVTLAAQEKPSQNHAKTTRSELPPLQQQLREIDSSRVDGKFLGSDGQAVPAGQALLSGLIEECFDIAQDIQSRQDDVALPLKPVYDRLTDIRRQLEQLLLTHRWTLRETDLWNFQVALGQIDALRKDGRFVLADGQAPQGQHVLMYLLRRCHGLLFRLMSSSEPISEELMPISNKLSVIKKCLTEVLKYGGEYSPRDLYPYQLALMQIDTLRADGTFKSADGSVPEGQAIIIARLEECHDLFDQLKEEIIPAESDESDDASINARSSRSRSRSSSKHGLTLAAFTMTSDSSASSSRASLGKFDDPQTQNPEEIQSTPTQSRKGFQLEP